MKTYLKTGKISPSLISKAYSYVKATMMSYDVMIVPENVGWDDVVVLAEKYRLLPSDARILATAINNGADKLATLDGDFERVQDVIELCPESFWR